MIKRFYILVLAGISATGAFATEQIKKEIPEVASAASDVTAESPEAFSSIVTNEAAIAQALAEGKELIRVKMVTVPFTLSETGHQVIQITYQGEKLNMVLDSAAGLNVFSKKTAERFGLKTDEQGATVDGLGASGYGMVELPPLAVTIAGEELTLQYVSSIDLKHVEAAAGETGTDGLIGLPFFLTRNATIDFGKRELSFMVFIDREQGDLRAEDQAAAATEKTDVPPAS